MNAMPLLWRIRTLKIFKFHENSKFKDDPWGNKRTFLPQGRWVVITPRLTSLNLWSILTYFHFLINIGAEFEATRCAKSSVPNQRRRSHETVVVFVRRLRYISSQKRIFAEEERKVICDSETLNVAVMKLLPREKLFSLYNQMVRAVGYSHAYSKLQSTDTPIINLIRWWYHGWVFRLRHRTWWH